MRKAVLSIEKKKTKTKHIMVSILSIGTTFDSFFSISFDSFFWLSFTSENGSCLYPCRTMMIIVYLCTLWHSRNSSELLPFSQQDVNKMQ